ncbi:MAG: hypothetical protein ACKVHQ_05095 [Gammaproteobacteria bacterium]|jgi:hypothetical protein
MSEDYEKFVFNLRNRFEESVNGIDAATLSRVRQTRAQVLEKSKHKGKSYLIWFPAGALASVCMALLIFSIVPQKNVEDQTFIDEIDIISDLDLYENLDFYEWLEQHELPS